MKNSQKHRLSKRPRLTQQSILQASIKRQLLRNPITTLSVAAPCLGSIFLVSFFLSLGSWPDFTITEMVPVAYVSAGIGTLLLLYIAFLIQAPATLLNKLRGLAHLTPSSRIWFGVANGVAALLLVSLLLSMVQTLTEHFGYGETNLVTYGVGLFAAALVLASPALTKPADTNAKAITASLSRPIAHGYFYLLGVAAVMVVVYGLVILSFFASIGLETAIFHQPVPLAMLQFVVAAAIIIVPGYLCALPGIQEDRPIRWLLVATFVGMLLMQTGALSVISQAIVRTLGLGEINSARIVLSFQGCAEVNAALGRDVCQANTAEATAIPVCPVTLKSRLGSQVVLDFADIVQSEDSTLYWLKDKKAWQDDLLSQRVILDKSHLLSWTRLPSLPRALTTMDESAFADSDALTAYCMTGRLGNADPK